MTDVLLMQVESEFVFMIPIVAIMVGGLIAIVTMLMNHQRKMAEILRSDREHQPGLVDEIRGMRAEMGDLRDRVNQQTLMLESRPQRPPPSPEVAERLTDQ